MADSGAPRRDSIVVIGGGGHAKVVISILRRLQHYLMVGYTDLRDRGLAVPYLGCDAELAVWAAAEQLNAVIAVGQVGLGEARCKLWERLRSIPLCFPAIVSPTAIVDEGASVAEGSVFMDGAVINTAAIVGRGAIVNTNSTIEHDVVLSDWVHVGPGATISGSATVGRCSMIGAGATVVEGISIAAGCMVGAGATVIRDLTVPGVYVGTPARRIK